MLSSFLVYSYSMKSEIGILPPQCKLGKTG